MKNNSPSTPAFIPDLSLFHFLLPNILPLVRAVTLLKSSLIADVIQCIIILHS